MTRESLIYLIAGGLFAGAAGINVGSEGAITMASVLLLAAGVVFGWLGVRKRQQPG